MTRQSLKINIISHWGLLGNEYLVCVCVGGGESDVRMWCKGGDVMVCCEGGDVRGVMWGGWCEDVLWGVWCEGVKCEDVRMEWRVCSTLIYSHLRYCDFWNINLTHDRLSGNSYYVCGLYLHYRNTRAPPTHTHPHTHDTHTAHTH